MRIAGLLLGLLLAAAPAPGAEVPRLLADVNRELTPGAHRGEPSGFFEMGGRLFFSTANPDSLDQAILWSTDGTGAGTVQLSTTLCLSSCQDIQPLAAWHGVTFLRVGAHRNSFNSFDRLARTDGTPEGTFPLTPLLRNEFFSEPLILHALPGEGGVFFSGCGPADSGACTLWRSDATRAGTSVFRGPDSAPFFTPRGLTVWRGRLYFVASRTPRGDSALWSTDGTAEGTRLVHEVRDFPGIAPAAVAALPSHLLFTSGEDLWATDGTPEGSRLVADFPAPDCADCQIPDVASIQASGDEAVFVTHRVGHGVEIWRSDGTAAGTRPAIELPAEVSTAYDLQRVAGRWLFVARAPDIPAYWTADGDFTRAERLTGCADGPCPRPGQAFYSPGLRRWLFTGVDEHSVGLWVTDGTGPGSRRLADVCPWIFQDRARPDFFPGPPGKVYFRSCSSTPFRINEELWITDGSPAGTRQVGGPVSGAGFFGGRLYFGTGEDAPPSSELWTTGETLDTARRVAVLRHDRPGSMPRFQPVRGGVVFAASQGEGRDRLWRSDGTPGGTVPILGFDPGFEWFLQDFLDLGSAQLFTVRRRKDGNDNTSQTEMWRTDGTAGGTRFAARLAPGDFVDGWASWNGRALFVTHFPDCVLGSSDGTPEGTREILPLLPALDCPTGLTPFGSRFLFVAGVRNARRPLTRILLSDGTPAGTRRIAQIEGSAFVDRSFEVDGTAYLNLIFKSPDGTSQLWQTDGTVGGTQGLSSLSRPSDLHVFGGSLYLTAALGPEIRDGRGLFRISSPGGPAVLLGRVLDSDLYFYPSRLRFAPVGGRLLFTVLEPGPEIRLKLWVTDGTPAGTRLLRGFLPPLPDNPFAPPDPLVSAGDRVFFGANDGTSGRELWESDGTSEGTRRVKDLAPGGYSALPLPASLAVANGFLFFAADDGKTGVEPWALRLKP